MAKEKDREPKPEDEPASTSPAAVVTPAKIELTEAELQQRIDAALKKERDAAESARRREKEESDRKKAEEQGEFQKLAQAEREKREQAERERDERAMAVRKLEVKDMLRDYVAEKHTAYAAAVRYMLPLVEFDTGTDDAEVKKRIAAIADQYVKDNPRTGGSGVPAQGDRKLPANTVPGRDQIRKENGDTAIPRSPMFARI
jgi:hypothetical protein